MLRAFGAQHDSSEARRKLLPLRASSKAGFSSALARPRSGRTLALTMKIELGYTTCMDRTTVLVGPEDRAAIEVIQPRYGVATEADAIRLALRVRAARPLLEIELPPRPQQAHRSPRKPSRA